MSIHQAKSAWFNQEFDNRNLKRMEYKTIEEQEEDEYRMFYCPIRDDARKIFEAGIPMMRSMHRGNRKR